MSDPALPDDLDRWPRDPYRLLGATPGASPRDLRRAYTRLIRTYKPEQFPEHFRRIREAYETVLHHAERFGPPEEPPSAPTPAPEPPREQTDQSPQDRSDLSRGRPSPEAPVPPLPRTSPAGAPRDELDGLWQLAVAGQEGTAYRRLLDLDGQQPGQVPLYLCLYWLLRVAPDLDGRRSPCDWLVQGLLAGGLTGPLRELYRREVEEDPAEALGERYARLLGSDVLPGPLADLLEERWRAAGRLGRWGLLADEVEAFRPRLQPADEEVWLRLLFALADELLWQEADGAAIVLGTCTREIRQHEYLGQRLAAEFDQFEFSASVARGWRTLRQGWEVPPDLLDLIAWSWRRPFPEVRPRLQALLGKLSRDPQRWLRFFDLVQQCSPPVLSQFGRLLDQFEEAVGRVPAGPHGPERTGELARDFLDALGCASYPNYRAAFLDFCLREAVAPERVAECVPWRQAHWPSKGVSLSRAIANDWPLRCVCRAYRLFWA
jgi:hypothetical protein